MDPSKNNVNNLPKEIAPLSSNLEKQPIANTNKSNIVASEVLEENKSTTRDRKIAMSKLKVTQKEGVPITKDLSSVTTDILPKSKSAEKKTGWKTAMTKDQLIKLDNFKSIISNKKLANVSNLYFTAGEMVDFIGHLLSQMSNKDKQTVDQYVEFLSYILKKPYIAKEFNDEIIGNKFINLIKNIVAIDSSYQNFISEIKQNISEIPNRNEPVISSESFTSFYDILPNVKDNITEIDRKSKIISNELKNIICYKCSGMGIKEAIDYLKNKVDNKFSQFASFGVSLYSKITLSLIGSDKKKFKQNIIFYILLATHSIHIKDYATANSVFISLQNFEELIEKIPDLECKYLYDDLKKLFNPLDNYTILRDKIDSECIFPVQILSRDVTALKDGNPLFDKNKNLKPVVGLLFEKSQAVLDAIPKFNSDFNTNLIYLLDDQPIVELAIAISSIVKPHRFFRDLQALCNEIIIKDIDKLNLENLETFIPILYKKINVLFMLVENWLPEGKISKVQKDEYMDTLKLIILNIKYLENRDNHENFNINVSSLRSTIQLFLSLLAEVKQE